MEGKRRAPQRVLSRACEANRLEEQVWILAYEQIWPLVRQAVKRKPAELEEPPGLARPAAKARRA